MPESNQTAAPKRQWPWWLGGMVLVAVMGVLGRYIGRACCGGKAGHGEKPGQAAVG